MPNRRHKLTYQTDSLPRYGTLQLRQSAINFLHNEAGVFIKVCPVPLDAPPLRFAADSDISEAVIAAAGMIDKEHTPIEVVFIDIGAGPDGCYRAKQVRLSREFQSTQNHGTHLHSGTCVELRRPVEHEADRKDRDESSSKSCGIWSIAHSANRGLVSESAPEPRGMQPLESADTHAHGAHKTLGAIRHSQRCGILRGRFLMDEDLAEHVDKALFTAHVALHSDDPEMMLQAVVEVVAVMCPPLAQVAKCNSETSVEKRAKGDLDVGRQQRLRSVLLQLLGLRGAGGLDLGDPDTMRLLKVPFEHIRDLIKQRDLSNVFFCSQWAALADVTCSFDEQPLRFETRTRAVVLRKREASHVQAQHYNPNAKVRALPNIEHRPCDAKLLKCSVCSHSIVSAWFFKHPVTQADMVLVPNNGHLPCKLPGRGRALYRVQCDYPSIDDLFVRLDFCFHGRRRDGCTSCAPNFCVHKKRLDKCERCCFQWKRVKRQRGSTSNNL